ncbi:MAG: hypothetical protein GF316_01445, partial [Candidatus Lokiarchaeota archaeon]|nr:hypothetical protein [Candidatus Lokiarchaeota archaeon]
KQWTGYPTQKHHRLLDRIIKLGSNEGDLIADFFCGSGTTLYAAENLKRRWIGCDNSQYAIYLTRKRLIELKIKLKTSNDIPFAILAELTSKKRKLIESGFFEKDLEIKRKN